MTIWSLSAEGEKYLREGLPEVNLAKRLLKPLPIKEARNLVENFSIALQWAKKNGWVKIENGRITRTGGAVSSPLTRALSEISEGKAVPKEIEKILLKRKLITKETAAIRAAKKFIGKEINQLTPELIKTGLWKKAKFRPYNVGAEGKPAFPGKRQPYKQFLELVRRKLVELGFKEMRGHLVETEFWNFDALYQAQNHPSRDWTQTYRLKYPKTGSLPKEAEKVKAAHENGWKTGSTGWGYRWDPSKAMRLMPRAHTTACSARQLASGVEIPGKYFTISRNFRPDVIDATHGAEFNQTEGIVIDPSLTFKNLLGILRDFAVEIGGCTGRVKFFTDYYPFTEPSVQLSAEHPELGMVEFGGAGIFRPELTEPLGVSEPVIAWGIGIDRLAMFKLGISDIRDIFSKKLDWMRNMRLVR